MLMMMGKQKERGEKRKEGLLPCVSLEEVQSRLSECGGERREIESSA